MQNEYTKPTQMNLQHSYLNSTFGTAYALHQLVLVNSKIMRVDQKRGISEFICDLIVWHAIAQAT